MTALWISLLSVVSTTVGGFCALALRRRLDRVLGFTAGAVLGLVCFELLPEILELASQADADGRIAIGALACGFLVVHGLQRSPGARGPGARGHCHHGRARRGTLYAVALVGHSFVDGLGIGLAFQVSEVAGAAVALAVIAHDFCDGLNTAGVMLAHGSSPAAARRMVLLDALAPVAGAAASFMLNVPPHALNVVLAFLAGSLLYIGAVGMLPRALAAHASSRIAALGQVAVAVSLGVLCAGGLRFAVA